MKLSLFFFLSLCELDDAQTFRQSTPPLSAHIEPPTTSSSTRLTLLIISHFSSSMTIIPLHFPFFVCCGWLWFVLLLWWRWRCYSWRLKQSGKDDDAVTMKVLWWELWWRRWRRCGDYGDSISMLRAGCEENEESFDFSLLISREFSFSFQIFSQFF